MASTWRYRHSKTQRTTTMRNSRWATSVATMTQKSGGVLGQKRPRIAYLTLNDPRDRRSWSGVHYHMAQALEKHCGQLTYIGPIKPAGFILEKFASRAFHRLTGRTYLHTHSGSLARRVARIAEQRMAGEKFDLIFAPAGSVAIAELRTSSPIVYLSDTTFRLMTGYSEFSGLLERSAQEADQIERRAIGKAELAIFSSSWASRSAIEHYQAPRKKVHVVPFGANLEDPPTSETALARRAPRDNCRLLFVGVDWERKGGDIAFETLLALRRRGLAAELTVVGCTPPRNFAHKNMKIVPFLDKNKPNARQLLSRLYLDADFFLLPTRAECFGIVFCEANAFGLPAIATDTGGVSEVVQNGVNGYLLPPSARGDEYARVIEDLYRDESRYSEMRVRSRAMFEERLNWDAWGNVVRRLLQELLGPDAIG